MIKSFFILFFLLACSFYLYGVDPVNKWPDLTKIKYVSGRVATNEDIKEGSAVFVLQSEGVPIGSPMKIKVPQYAIHTNEETKEKTRVVIIQAEEANGQQIIGGLIISTNEYMAGLFHEFTLLGNDKPSEDS